MADLTELRQRYPGAYLRGYMDELRRSWCDRMRVDRVESDGSGRQLYRMHWRFGDTELLLTASEVEGKDDIFVIRLRGQVVPEGQATGDRWEDFAKGQFQDYIRAARKRKGPSAADLKALRNENKHDGPTPENIIIQGYSGSHAYNLNHNGFTTADGRVIPPSDVDTRSVFFVPTSEVLKLGRRPELVEQKATDTRFDEVERFLVLCLKSNPERLEMLGCPKKDIITPEGQLIIDMQRGFLSKKVIHSYGGYAKTQMHLIDRRGDRAAKPLMHLIRLMLTGTRILKEGVVDPDMSEYRERLMGIRTGEVGLNEAIAWYEELEAAFTVAAADTKLPDLPDRDKANTVLLEIRRRHW
jgi:predicted nucleotidyltransferase